MNKSKLRQIIREELKIVLSEVYKDKFKISGRLITNIKERPQKEVLSDIRAIAGVTIVSTDEIQDYSEQRRGRFLSVLNLKIDGFPYMKSGFNRDTIIDIAEKIRKVPNVISFKYNPEDIQPI